MTNNDSTVVFKQKNEHNDGKEESWTTQRLIDELYLCLIDFRDSMNENLRNMRTRQDTSSTESLYTNQHLLF